MSVRYEMMTRALSYRSDMQGISRLRYQAVFAILVDRKNETEFIDFNSFLADDPLLVPLDARANLATFLHSHWTQTCRCLLLFVHLLTVRIGQCKMKRHRLDFVNARYRCLESRTNMI